MTEYRIVISVEEIDDSGQSVAYDLLTHRWTAGTRLIHGLNEAERIAKVLSVAQVPGA